MRKLFIILLLSVSCATFAQLTESYYGAHDFEVRDLSGTWTDGHDSWEGTINDFALQLDSPFGHFSFIQREDEPYDYQYLYRNDFFDAKYFEIYVDNKPKRSLVVYDNSHKPVKIFKQADSHAFLPFFGTYTDEQGRKAIIDSKRIVLPGISGQYRANAVGEAFEPVAKVYPKGFDSEEYKAFYLKLTLQGVDVYEAINEDFEAFCYDSEPGKLLFRLTYNGAEPRWKSMMCDDLTPHAIYRFVPDDILGVMRNLPHALKGYKFSTQRYKDYFESQPWYHPADSNEGISLNEVELINSQLVKHIETECGQ